MDNAALTFYQQFYADLTLYVVPDEATDTPADSRAAAATAAAEVAAVPTSASPAPAPTSPAPVAAPAATPPPVAPAFTPAPPVSQPMAPVAPPRTVVPVPPATLPVVPPRTVVPVAPVAPPVAPPRTTITLPTSPAPPQRTAPPLTETPYSTLGGNARGIVILVRLDAVRFQRLPRNVFLNNVLKAIGQIVEDTVLINVESHLPVALSTLRQQLAARQIIGFGKNLLDVAVHKTQLYEPVILAGDAAYLPAAELEVIEEDQGRKKLLWNAMKRMFLE